VYLISFILDEMKSFPATMLLIITLKRQDFFYQKHLFKTAFYGKNVKKIVTVPQHRILHLESSA